MVQRIKKRYIKVKLIMVLVYMKKVQRLNIFDIYTEYKNLESRVSIEVYPLTIIEGRCLLTYVLCKNCNNKPEV